VVQLAALIRLQRRLRAQILHFHSALPHGELIVPMRLLRSFLGDPRIVVTPYTSARSDYPKLRARSGLVAADGVIASSRWSADAAIRAGARPERCFVVPASVDPVSELSDKRLQVVVALGRLKHVKGFDVLIDAFDRAALTRPDWSLRIGGEGTERDRLEARIRASRHADRIELLGGVYDDAKQRLLGESAIGVVPSRAENFPGTLLEFEAHGLACIASDVGGIPELARNGAALLVPPGDSEALARALGELMDDAELRTSMGRAAAKSASTLDPDTNSEQLELAYRAILERAGGASPP